MTRRLTVAWSPSSFADVDDAPIRLLEGLGIEVRPNGYGRRLTESEAIDHLQGVDGLIAGLEPLNRTVLSSAPTLKVIARVGIGMDNIDHDAASEFGIKVSNTPDAPSGSVAELTVAAALALTRGLRPLDASMHRRAWGKAVTPGLKGSTVLIVGFGRIGKAVYERLRPFGAEILVCDPALDALSQVDAQLVSLGQGLARATIVSLHAAGRDQILGLAELRALGPGGIVLNSARGELVDEAALVACLKDGTITGAWFDVFSEEPYDGPLCDFDEVLLTPHVGTYTESCRREMEMQATLNLLRDLDVPLPSVR